MLSSFSGWVQPYCSECSGLPTPSSRIGKYTLPSYYLFHTTLDQMNMAPTRVELDKSGWGQKSSDLNI